MLILNKLKVFPQPKVLVLPTVKIYLCHFFQGLVLFSSVTFSPLCCVSILCFWVLNDDEVSTPDVVGLPKEVSSFDGYTTSIIPLFPTCLIFKTGGLKS